MKKTEFFINSCFFFWFIALIGWFLTYFYVSVFSFLTSFLFILLHFNQTKVMNMFGKKTPKVAQTEIVSQKNTEDKLDREKNTEDKLDKEKSSTTSEERKNTIISHEVVFEGNITSNEPIYVYGKVKGDITAKNNTVRIMLNGEVIGNIVSKSLIINGKINGECHSEDMVIEDNGQVEGTIHYTTLSIKKGGVFMGNAQLTLQSKNSSVTDIKKRKFEQTSEQSIDSKASS